jgi:hypothetical protein
MAYVIVEGPVRTAEYGAGFSPETVREGETIIRFLDILTGSGKDRILVETVVVESGRSVRFYIEVRDREGSVNVRPEPLTDPEKTPGVKRSVALVATRVRSLSDAAVVGNTNIGEYLPET